MNNYYGKQPSAKPQYSTARPWEAPQGDITNEFEKSLQAMDKAEIHPPWEEGSTELHNEEEARRKAEGYRYESMFEVPPPTAKQVEQLKNYEYVPPYRTSFNVVNEVKPTPKKMMEGMRPRTRAPYDYGSLPSDPVAKKIAPRPSTALWNTPAPAPKDEHFESSGDPILDSLIKQLKKHGASGIQGLARKFRIMDDDGSGELSESEFTKGMKEVKLVDLGDKAIKHLFRYFDKDDSGAINYDEFLVGVRGVLNPRRKGMVHLAFKILDKDGSGEIDITDISAAYNAKAHPDVIMERRTEKEILQEFMLNFEKGSKEQDGIVTLEEFENYYANISASIDTDDYFELMMRNAWHISGGEGQLANSTNRRVLVTHADGRQSVEEIKDDMGIGAKDTKEMTRRLQKQGLDIATIGTTGGTGGGMNGQTEAEGFYKSGARQQQQAQYNEYLQGQDERNAQKQQQRGRLSDFAATASGQQQQQQQQYGSRRPSDSSGRQSLANSISGRR